MRLLFLTVFLIVNLLGAKDCKAQGVGTFQWTNGAPNNNPGLSGAKFAVDKNTYRWYEWVSGTTWVGSGDRIQSITGCSAPNYTPTIHQSWVVINNCDPNPELYAWNGVTWRIIDGGGGGTIDAPSQEIVFGTGTGVTSSSQLKKTSTGLVLVGKLDIDSGSGSTSVGSGAGLSASQTVGTNIGFQAGQFDTSVAAVNVGYFAGKNNKGGFSVNLGGLSGESNTGSESLNIGHQAGRNNTSNLSVNIGSFAGKDNTGYRSINIGFGAGERNVGQSLLSIGEGCFRDNEGLENLGIGGFAGRDNTTGTRDIFIGHSAGHKNRTGVDNVYVGLRAGYNQNGSGNTLVGESASDQGVDGIDNTGVGKQVQHDNYNGNYNVSVGALSLYNLTTLYAYEMQSGQTYAIGFPANTNWLSIGASDTLANTLFTYNGAAVTGTGSVRSLVGSSRNTAIGDRAGYLVGTASGTVYLGYNTGLDTLYKAKDNILVIDNSNTTSPLIGGSFAANKVGINAHIDSIYHTLTVNGTMSVRGLVGKNSSHNKSVFINETTGEFAEGLITNAVIDTFVSANYSQQSGLSDGVQYRVTNTSASIITVNLNGSELLPTGTNNFPLPSGASANMIKVSSGLWRIVASGTSENFLPTGTSGQTISYDAGNRIIANNQLENTSGNLTANVRLTTNSGITANNVGENVVITSDGTSSNNGILYGSSSGYFSLSNQSKTRELKNISTGWNFVGNVGNGIDAPLSPFHIKSATNAFYTTQFDGFGSTSSPAKAGIVMKAAVIDAAKIESDARFNSGINHTDLRFFVNNSSGILINQFTMDGENGRLGVGVADPTVAVDVVGDVKSSGSIIPGRWTTATRPTPAANTNPIGFNTTTGKHEGWDGSAWNSFY